MSTLLVLLLAKLVGADVGGFMVAPATVRLLVIDPVSLLSVVLPVPVLVLGAGVGMLVGVGVGVGVGAGVGARVAGGGGEGAVGLII